jgi:hypothetical protein
MTEAMRRMEAGEDPDEIEEELGELIESEEPFAAGPVSGQGAAETLRRLRRELLPAARDDNWYPLRPEESDTGPGRA